MKDFPTIHKVYSTYILCTLFRYTIIKDTYHLDIKTHTHTTVNTEYKTQYIVLSVPSTWNDFKIQILHNEVIKYLWLLYILNCFNTGL